MRPGMPDPEFVGFEPTSVDQHRVWNPMRPSAHAKTSGDTFHSRRSSVVGLAWVTPFL